MKVNEARSKMCPFFEDFKILTKRQTFPLFVEFTEAEELIACKAKIAELEAACVQQRQEVKIN